MIKTPIRSGNAIVDAVFDLCVQILLWLADLFGVSYNTINIWIFCVLWPIFTVVLISVVVRQYLKIRRLKKELKQQKCEQTSAAASQNQAADLAS
jgi:uncharacterized membrane protein YcjF (UPF0283 family)